LSARLPGETVLYHYLQKNLLKKDVWLFQSLAARLLVDLGVWMPPAAFEELPLILPFAVRDPLSRGNKSQGIPDQWGSPNSHGYFRDDNSLVKSIPKNLPIRAGATELYRRKYLGSGFVAAHVWRRLTDGGLAARHPLTYSFVPNLVWLPSEVAKLTDREGSFAQAYLQAVSLKIFRDVPVYQELKQIAESAWELLPEPVGIPEEGLPSAEGLNYFDLTEAFLPRRRATILRVYKAIDSIVAGHGVTEKIVSSRYTSGLPSVPVQELTQLQTRLAGFASGSLD
jgi:hypothetical protein